MSAIAYGLLAIVVDGPIAPKLVLGVACGAGGLVGGYLGVQQLQPRMPETVVRLLGVLAIGLAVAYVVEAIR